MISLKDYILEQLILERRQIQLPSNNNQFIVLAGGGGSGKGHVQQFINVDFKVFDVDELKKLYNNYRNPGKKYKFENPDDVFTMHKIVSGLGWKEKHRALVNTAARVAKPGQGPNVLLDMTAKDAEDLDEALALCPEGYTSTLIWVVQSVEIAKFQNKLRSRNAPEELLIKTHEMVYNTVPKYITTSHTPQFDHVWFYIAYNDKLADVTNDELLNKAWELEKDGDKFIIPNELMEIVDEYRGRVVSPNAYKNLQAEEERKRKLQPGK